MYILQQNRRNYRTSFMGMRMFKRFLNETLSWLNQHGIQITLNEKSFIFGIDPKSDINKLVIMEIKYYIY